MSSPLFLPIFCLFLAVISYILFTTCLMFIVLRNLSPHRTSTTLPEEPGKRTRMAHSAVREMLDVQYPSCHSLDCEGTCVICLETMQVDYVIRRFKCGHSFHDECIIEWLTKENSCPICRSPVLRN